MKIVLLTKRDDFSRQAQQIAASLFGTSLTVAEGAVGDDRPDCLKGHGDYLVSFLSPWIITAAELSRFGTSINFHPGSADYPGTGCYNFALYEGSADYGATCHHMLPKVDTGAIVLERRFNTFQTDTVAGLKLRTMVTMVSMFCDIVCGIAQGDPLPVGATHWTRRAFTWREMEALKVLRPTMSEAEIARRVRATTFPGYPGPRMVANDGWQATPDQGLAAVK
nr:formyltransferase family protein [Sphingomonas xinjiangensis]